jgi:hypothetical protein
MFRTEVCTTGTGTDDGRVLVSGCGFQSWFVFVAKPHTTDDSLDLLSVSPMSQNFEFLSTTTTRAVCGRSLRMIGLACHPCFNLCDVGWKVRSFVRRSVRSVCSTCR